MELHNVAYSILLWTILHSDIHYWESNYIMTPTFSLHSQRGNTWRQTHNGLRVLCWKVFRSNTILVIIILWNFVRWTNTRERERDRNRERGESYAPKSYRHVKPFVHLCDVYMYVDRCLRYLTYLEDLPTQEVLFHRQ